MSSQIFGTSWKSPRRLIILAVAFFAVIMGLFCFLIVKTVESAQASDDDETPLSIGFSSEVLQAAFDPAKQRRLLAAEFKLFEGEKAIVDKNYKAGHEAFAESADGLTSVLGYDAAVTRIVLVRAGEFEQRFRKWKLAEDYFRRSLKEPLNPGLPKTFPIIAQRFLANILARQGKWEEAIAFRKKNVEFAKTLRSSDKTTLIYALTALADSYADDSPESLKSYNDAIAIIQSEQPLHRTDERNSYVYSSRGHWYLLSQRNEEALADYNAAIALDGKDEVDKAYRGCALHRLGRSNESLKDFNEAIEADPKESWFYYRRGQAYSALNEHQKAIDDFANAEKLGRKNDTINEYVDKQKVLHKPLLQAASEARKKEELLIK